MNRDRRDILAMVRQMGGSRLRVATGGKHPKLMFFDSRGKWHCLVMPQGSGADPRAHINRRAELRRMLNDQQQEGK